MSTVWADRDGTWRTTLRRRQVLSDPRINKGTALSDSERAALGLIGLIPAGHMTLEEQVSRVYAQYRRQTTDLARNVLMTENYSHEYRRPRGIYLSVDRPELIEASLRSAGLGADEVDLIVATDAG